MQIGHRESVDLDLFCESGYDQDKIYESLPQPNEKFSQSEVFLGVNIRGVKCDFVKYSFPRIEPLVIEDGIRMASSLEIAGMKLWAITRRGSKKDFIDLYFLLKQYSLDEMVTFFRRKFPNIEPFMVLRSLTWFEDAEENPTPEIYHDIEWEEIKETINKAANKYLLGN